MRRLAPVMALLVVLAGAGVGVQPVAAGPATESGKLTDALQAQIGTFAVDGLDPTDEVVRYGTEGYLGYTVRYDDGANDSLQEWANASDARDIRHEDTDANWAVISAPVADVGVLWPDRMLPGATLVELDYVTSVGVNRRVEVDPITSGQLAAESSWEQPAGAWIAQGPAGLWGGSFTSEGVAFGSDVTNRSLSNATDAIAVDDVTSVDGTGITVGIVDTGLNYKEHLFGSRVIAGKNTITGETINASNGSYDAIADGNEHGSWVATAIAGDGSAPTAQGVAPGADLVIAKALADDGSGETADVAAGIEYVCSQGADVVSLSLGAPFASASITAEIDECLEDEDVSAVIVAAGNSRTTYRYLASPADHERTIAVAATDAKATNQSESAYFSQVGPDPQTGADVAVGAPGMELTAQLATDVNGTLRNRTLSGTSMATPLVAGVAALVLEADSSLQEEPDGLQERLEATADPLEQAGTTEVGHGRINASAAVDDTEPNETQTEARDTTAEGRDAGNEALSGSVFRGFVATTREEAAAA